ncbi:MAG: MerR family DNA-binding transcriptional regulator [Planctomycetaceae bacterium]|nr:MerR family DNA-binding transcriptional regulator [Planctomycetaceae bacterium]
MERPNQELPLDDDGRADGLSIGDVAQQTGISPDTLRMWERRYGRPVPVRLPSGHRRFTSDQLRWLRQVAEGLALGLRPSVLVPAEESELAALLDAKRPLRPASPRIAELLGWVRATDDVALRAALLDDWRARTPDRFLSEILGPLLEEIGTAWCEGRIEVRHEHMASEVIADVLRTLRGTLPRVERGPLVLFATLTGELHGLGLQMGALCAAMVGARTRVLGADTPSAEIAHAAREVGADVVAISVSLASGGVETDRDLAQLRHQLDPHVRLLVGGRGARVGRRGPRGIEYLDRLDQFGPWLWRTGGDAPSESAP